MFFRALAVVSSGVAALAIGVIGSVATAGPVAPESAVEFDPGCATSLTQVLMAARASGQAPAHTAVHLSGPTAARSPSATAPVPVEVLGCDHRDRGRAVISFGDPTTADNLVVLVPGSDTDLSTLVPAPGEALRPHGLPLDWARALAEHAPPRTAVVLWVGYETPQGLGRAAVTGAAARAAAPALAEEVADLQQLAPHHPRTTVIGHSYGAVVAAVAAHALDVDSLVLVASPGAHAHSVEQLGTTALVWAMQSPHDWIRRVPGWRIGDLGHGTKPTRASFGAHVIPADDVTAHDDYFTPGRSTFTALESIIATSTCSSRCSTSGTSVRLGASATPTPAPPR